MCVIVHHFALLCKILRIFVHLKIDKYKIEQGKFGYNYLQLDCTVKETSPQITSTYEQLILSKMSPKSSMTNTLGCTSTTTPLQRLMRLRPLFNFTATLCPFSATIISFACSTVICFFIRQVLTILQTKIPFRGDDFFTLSHATKAFHFTCYPQKYS